MTFLEQCMQARELLTALTTAVRNDDYQPTGEELLELQGLIDDCRVFADPALEVSRALRLDG